MGFSRKTVPWISYFVKLVKVESVTRYLHKLHYGEVMAVSLSACMSHLRSNSADFYEI